MRSLKSGMISPNHLINDREILEGIDGIKQKYSNKDVLSFKDIFVFISGEGLSDRLLNPSSIRTINQKLNS